MAVKKAKKVDKSRLPREQKRALPRERLDGERKRKRRNLSRKEEQKFVKGKRKKKGLSKWVKRGFVFLGEGSAESSCSLCVTFFGFVRDNCGLPLLLSVHLELILSSQGCRPMLGHGFERFY